MARPDVRAKLSIAAKSAMARPDVRAKHRDALERPGARAKRSAASKEKWTKPGYKERIRAAIKASWQRPKARDRGTKAAWHLDHSHATGAVRGVLCHRCNRGSCFLESARLLQRALTYISRQPRAEIYVQLNDRERRALRVQILHNQEGCCAICGTADPNVQRIEDFARARHHASNPTIQTDPARANATTAGEPAHEAEARVRELEAAAVKALGKCDGCGQAWSADDAGNPVEDAYCTTCYEATRGVRCVAARADR